MLKKPFLKYFVRKPMKDNILKIAIVGNCQSTALASIIYRSIGVKVEIIVDINASGTEAYKHAHWAVSNEDKVDFCFSQPLSDEFGAISSNQLRKKYGARYKQFTNLYFTGFHPDLTYFGSRAVRLQSALGDYHSRIALIGYIKGMSVSKTLDLFNFTSYERLEYFSNFDKSKIELLNRDEKNDVKFAAEFFEIAGRNLPLYTVNHPTVYALAPLAEMIIESTGLRRPTISTELMRNPLTEGSIWPVYIEIGKFLNLQYTSNMIFYPSFSQELPPMNLEKFVIRSFELYDEVGRNKLMDVPGAIHLRQQNL